MIITLYDLMSSINVNSAAYGAVIYLSHLLSYLPVNDLFCSDTPCGVPTVQPVSKRIVGGTVAKPGSWPWTVHSLNISISGFS